jgi:CRISPR-associated protein Cas1
VLAIAQIATAAVGALPALGFIHEDSGLAFCLDVADLYRDSVTVPVAFAAAQSCRADPRREIEREVRRLCAKEFRRQQLASRMIERIQALLRADTLDPRRPAPAEEADLAAPTEVADADDPGSDP